MENFSLVAQRYMIEKIMSHTLLKNIISGVYVYLPDEVKFPYGHIQKITTKNFGSKTTKGIDIRVVVKFYSNQKNFKELYIIEDCLSQIFGVVKAEECGTFISYIKSQEITHPSKGGNYVLTSEINIKVAA